MRSFLVTMNVSVSCSVCRGAGVVLQKRTRTLHE